MSNIDEKQEKRQLLLKLTRLLGIPGAYVNGTFYRTDILDRFERPTEWNPLKDDKDSFRLAMQMEMEVDFYNQAVAGFHRKTGKAFFISSKGEDIKSMRRAIVELAILL